MEEILRRAREKQPGLIVVDRAVPGPHQNYLTPENTVPEGMLPHPWESCIIMGGGWSYTPGARMKPARELIHLLADIVAKGGNLLLNIGPGPDGTWYPEAYERLEEIGAWLRVNGRAVYGTRPLKPHVSGRLRLTRGKDGVGYAIVLAGVGAENPPAEVELPGLRPAVGAHPLMLGSKERLRWRPTAGGCRIFIPEPLRKKPPCRHAWVVRLGRQPGGAT
jgi:alpha-L-fucosidase